MKVISIPIGRVMFSEKWMRDLLEHPKVKGYFERLSLDIRYKILEIMKGAVISDVSTDDNLKIGAYILYIALQDMLLIDLNCNIPEIMGAFMNSKDFIEYVEMSYQEFVCLRLRDEKDDEYIN